MSVRKFRVSSTTITLIGLAIVLVTAIFIFVVDKIGASEASAIRMHINEVGKEIERGSLAGYITKLSDKAGLKYHVAEPIEKYAVYLTLDDSRLCEKLVNMLIADKESLVIDGHEFTRDQKVTDACQIPPIKVSVVRRL